MYLILLSNARIYKDFWDVVASPTVEYDIGSADANNIVDFITDRWFTATFNKMKSKKFEMHQKSFLQQK